MIENKNEASRNLEKALEQAKQRVANEKKKQNEKKRKAENHHKYIMGGIIVKYFPDCYRQGNKDVLVCMEICKGSGYNSDVGNKQDILICKEETVP